MKETGLYFFIRVERNNSRRHLLHNHREVWDEEARGGGRGGEDEEMKGGDPQAMSLGVVEGELAGIYLLF